jgi:hypothetical protein
VNEICGGTVQRKCDKLFVSTASMDNGRNWRNIREILRKIEQLISFYETKEVTAIIELALWKSKLDQVGCKLSDRNEYHIEVPGPVKEIILEYFKLN